MDMKSGRAILFYAVIAIFVATAVITLLGVINVVAIDDKYLNALFGVLIVELAASVVGLFKATDWFGQNEESAVADIGGDWWQFLRQGEEHGLSHVHISFSESEKQVKLNGRAFTTDAGNYAQFWSVAASLNAAKLEFYYFWQGDHNQSDDDFSGVGFIRFSRQGKGIPQTATGWFTKGDIFRASVTEKKKAEYRRLTEAELRVMASDGDAVRREELLRSVYNDWATRSRHTVQQ